MQTEKEVEFYHVKLYLDYGAIAMRGFLKPKEDCKGGKGRYSYGKVMVGTECEGKQMSPYLYFQDEWFYTKEEAERYGNKLIHKEIQECSAKISKLIKRLKY